MKKSIGLLSIVLGCVAVSGGLLSLGAPKADASIGRLPLTYQQGRADAFTCPSPAPVGTSGKIVAGTGNGDFYGTVNCAPAAKTSGAKASGVTAKGAAPGPIAYLYHGRPPGEPLTTRLRTVPGATGTRAFGVAQNGEVVGEMLFGAQGRPYRWTSGGEPIALGTPSDGIAAAVGKGGLPIVGEALNRQGVLQAAWFAPTPGFFIGPAAPSLLYAVTEPPIGAVPVHAVYAGELAGFAAAAIAPNALKRLPSVKFPSTAFAINERGFIVGGLVLPGNCGNDPRVSGFATQFPDGRLELVPPLAGDCISNALDVNDTNAIVGYSGLPAVQRADGLNLTKYPPGLTDLNASRRYGKIGQPPPWTAEGHRLIAATGTDDRGDIAATDSAGKVWFLHIP